MDRLLSPGFGIRKKKVIRRRRDISRTRKKGGVEKKKRNTCKSEMVEIRVPLPLWLHQGSVQGSGGLRMPRFGVLIPFYFFLVLFSSASFFLLKVDQNGDDPRALNM
jgi:hypothetical protein